MILFFKPLLQDLCSDFFYRSMPLFYVSCFSSYMCFAISTLRVDVFRVVGSGLPVTTDVH